jgi:hypothetical protein
MNCCNSCACERCITVAHIKAFRWDAARNKYLAKERRAREVREIQMMQVQSFVEVGDYMFGGAFARHVLAAVVLTIAVVWFANQPDAVAATIGYDYDRYFQ